MSETSFATTLNEQVAYEFAAHQQYVAIAAHYDGETLPQLAAFFYRQAIEERNHAMMIVQYLLDAGHEVTVPGVEAPQSRFPDTVAPVQLALDQEKRVSEQVANLARLAREEGNYQGEQFMQWFIKEQVEEVSSMSAPAEDRRARQGQPPAGRGVPGPREGRRRGSRPNSPGGRGRGAVAAARSPVAGP